jgi:hypothetical protein
VNTVNTVTNTALRVASTPPDFNPNNDRASARVTGSTVPGLPNTGTPAGGGAVPEVPLPVAGVLLLIIVVATAYRRKRTG